MSETRIEVWRCADCGLTCPATNQREADDRHWHSKTNCPAHGRMILCAPEYPTPAVPERTESIEQRIAALLCRHCGAPKSVHAAGQWCARRTFEPQTAVPERDGEETEAAEIIRRARDEISRLCAGRGSTTRCGLAGRDWTMCVPVQEDDSDRTFAALADLAERLLHDRPRHQPVGLALTIAMDRKAPPSYGELAVAYLDMLRGVRDSARPEGEDARGQDRFGADRLAGAVCAMIDRGVLDARSEPGDALLDYASARYGDTSPISRVRARYDEIRRGQASTPTRSERDGEE